MTTISLHEQHTSLGKTLGSITLAIIMTFTLFVLMDKLIHKDQIHISKPVPTPVIEVTSAPEESQTIERAKTLPKPPPTLSEPPRTQVAVNSTEITSYGDGFDGTPDIGAGLDKFTLTGSGSAQEGGVRPIVRIAPRYPIDAARNGIEGWVQLTFTVSKTGTVENIKVINASPKRTFDKEAVRALRRWKYKPQVQNGVAMTQENVSVQLDFNLDNS